MILTAFYGTCMALILYLFVLSGNLASPAAWLYASFLLALYAGMLKTGRASPYRRILVIAFAALFSVSYIGNLRDAYGSAILGEAAMLDGAIPFNQFLIPAMPVLLALTRTVQFPSPITGGPLSVLGLILVWSMAVITIGKGWCGWVCPFGGFEEGFSRLPGRARIQASGHGKRLRFVQLALLALSLIVSAITLSPAYAYWMNPFNVVTGHFSSGNIAGRIAVAACSLLFAGLVVALPFLTKKRFQCAAYCPLGALQSLLCRLSSFKVTIDADACDHCMKCVEACPFVAIDGSAISSRASCPSNACALCGECVEACPKKAISFRYSFEKGEGPLTGPNAAQGGIPRGLLDPRLVFTFTAFTFCAYLSATFALDAIERILAFFGGLL